ncbi:major facilitator superfamily domain-containing protein [Dactylonectria estremocensis]|uniref:Major facilitator superfamily domain-containing protein n=1 Tax=Dactylonectria estremocensis TaxID=1079267 RepID=A0A9P9DWJ2_9HYPO|nr:major facilitator superfamily domain-containing protein [Dactylonectria estremocensis]
MSKSPVHEEKVSPGAVTPPDNEQTPIADADHGRDGLDGEGQGELQPRIHARTFMALFAICLIYFSQTFALVGTGAQGQTIAAYLDRPADAIWLTASIAIPSVVLGPVVAQSADYWGRRWFLVISSILGAVGCAVASRADSFAMFIAGMVITGIDFGVLPLLHAVPSEILPRRWRAPAQAAVMIANSFGLVVGLILGGLFDRNGHLDGFRNYYYIATGMFALGGIICFFAYQPPPTALQASLTLRQKLAQLDWVGYFLLASGLVLFCMGLAWSQNPYEWSDPHTSAPFAIGLALAIALVVYETRFKADGMFHHGLFSGKDWNFAISLGAVFCEGLAFFAATVYFPYQVTVLYEEDPLLVGVRFSIAFLATIPASILTGLYCTIAKKVRWIAVFSFLIFVAFFACMATADETTDIHAWGYPVLLGSALGMTLIILVTVAQLSTPRELISLASGLMISMRSLGGTVGIAIYNAVFRNALSQLAGDVADAATETGLPGESVGQFVYSMLRHNQTGLAQVPGVTPAIIESGAHVFQYTHVKGFQHVWITAAAFVALSTTATVFLTDPSSEFNNAIDAPVENEENIYRHRL